MKLEELVYRVESRLFSLGRTLLQADEKSSLREELEFAQAELSAREADLAQAEARRDELRQRIVTLQTDISSMPEQIKDSHRRGKHSQALRQAMQLERTRGELATSHAELPKLEQTIWSLGFHLRQMRRRLARIRDQIPGR
jgi:predicted  nucleic acid-binding Zn-ribbon protein